MRKDHWFLYSTSEWVTFFQEGDFRDCYDESRFWQNCPETFEKRLWSSFLWTKFVIRVEIPILMKYLTCRQTWGSEEAKQILFHRRVEKKCRTTYCSRTHSTREAIIFVVGVFELVVENELGELELALRFLRRSVFFSWTIILYHHPKWTFLLLFFAGDLFLIFVNPSYTQLYLHKESDLILAEYK